MPPAGSHPAAARRAVRAAAAAAGMPSTLHAPLDHCIAFACPSCTLSEPCSRSCKLAAPSLPLLATARASASCGACSRCSTAQRLRSPRQLGRWAWRRLAAAAPPLLLSPWLRRLRPTLAVAAGASSSHSRCSSEGWCPWHRLRRPHRRPHPHRRQRRPGRWAAGWRGRCTDTAVLPSFQPPTVRPKHTACRHSLAAGPGQARCAGGGSLPGHTGGRHSSQVRAAAAQWGERACSAGWQQPGLPACCGVHRGWPPVTPLLLHLPAVPSPPLAAPAPRSYPPTSSKLFGGSGPASNDDISQLAAVASRLELPGVLPPGATGSGRWREAWRTTHRWLWGRSQRCGA